MISKKIKKRSPVIASGRAEFAYMSRLGRYIVRAEAEDLRKLLVHSDDAYLRQLAEYAIAHGRSEKLLGQGSVNLTGDTFEEWQPELAALLHRDTTPGCPIDHWVLSWRETDDPQVDEVEDSVAIFLRSQGLSRCPAVWGFHGDTDNPHVHVMVVRLDPVTAKRQEAGQGWDIDTGHRGIAVIESRYPHWSREDDALYRVEGGLLIDQKTGRSVGPADKPERWLRINQRNSGVAEAQLQTSLSARGQKHEQDTGQMSRERVAREVAAPILLDAATWEQAHRGLAREGISIAKKGTNGAVLWIDGKPIKASTDRRTSLRALETLYGEPFKLSVHAVAVTAASRSLSQEPGLQQYYAARATHNERVSAITSDLRRIWGRGAGPAHREALAAAVSETGFPSFESWNGGARPPNPSDTVLASLQIGGLNVTAADNAMTAARLVGDFQATVLANRTIYRSSGTQPSRRVMVDTGDKIFIEDSANAATVRAGLVLMAARFPENRVTVNGDKQFQRLVYKIAKAEGIRLDGPLGRALDRRRALDRMILLAAKLFHNQEWLPKSFHWPVPADGPPRHVPGLPAIIDDIVTTVPRFAADKARPQSDLLQTVNDDGGPKPTPAEAAPGRQKSDDESQKAAARAAAARAAAIQAGFGR
jgi:hypothetical protein